MESIASVSKAKYDSNPSLNVHAKSRLSCGKQPEDHWRLEVNSAARKRNNLLAGRDISGKERAPSSSKRHKKRGTAALISEGRPCGALSSTQCFFMPYWGVRHFYLFVYCR